MGHGNSNSAMLPLKQLKHSVELGQNQLEPSNGDIFFWHDYECSISDIMLGNIGHDLAFPCSLFSAMLAFLVQQGPILSISFASQ